MPIGALVPATTHMLQNTMVDQSPPSVRQSNDASEESFSDRTEQLLARIRKQLGELKPQVGNTATGDTVMINKGNQPASQTPKPVSVNGDTPSETSPALAGSSKKESQEYQDYKDLASLIRVWGINSPPPPILESTINRRKQLESFA